MTGRVGIVLLLAGAAPVLQPFAGIEPVRTVTILNDTHDTLVAVELFEQGGARPAAFPQLPPGQSIRIDTPRATSCPFQIRLRRGGRAISTSADLCRATAFRLSALLAPPRPSPAVLRSQALWAPLRWRAPSPPRSTLHAKQGHKAAPTPPPPPPGLDTTQNSAAHLPEGGNKAAENSSAPAVGSPLAPARPAGHAVGDSRGEPFCRVLQRPAAPDECAQSESIVQNAEHGRAGIAAPKEMQEGETATVSFAVTREKNRAVSTVLGTAPTQTPDVSLSGVMAARLSGDGFRIEATTPEMQQVGAIGGQRWDWKVTALPAPRHNLTLSVYVAAREDDPPAKQSVLLAQEIPIAVKVSAFAASERGMDAASEWLGHVLKLENAVWAVLTAGLAVALWKLLERWRGRGKPKQRSGGRRAKATAAPKPRGGRAKRA
jgi:hypothetical protein